MRRRSVLLLVIATMVVSSVTTLIASSQIRSPADVAASTAPPAPSPILAPVKDRVLVSRVVTRGTGHHRSPQQLWVTRSPLKSGPQIVTRVPVVGSQIEHGEVLMTVSGRPVFLLRGTEPSYRDLGPGMSGKDVEQLERSLSRAGFDPGSVDGVYDATTGAALASMYRTHGFEPFVATARQLAATRPTEAELVAGGQAGAGFQLPSDEVVFVGTTRLRVTKVVAGLGATAEGALVTVASSEVVVDGLLPIDQAELVRPGAEVVLDESSLGIKATGTVSHVATRPGTRGGDSFHVSFRVAVNDPPPTLVGSSVRITVPIESTKEAGLTVPVSALSLSPDGGSKVRRSVDGRLDDVLVEPGLSADGFVVVTARGGSLRAGDLVLIGFDATSSARG